MLSRLEALENYAGALGIILNDQILRKEDALDGQYLEISGRYMILLNRHRPQKNRFVALAEEIGHHIRSTGNITELATVSQRKSENAGKAWAIEFLLPLCKFAFATLLNRCKTTADYAETFEYPEEFVAEAIAYYKRKGLWPASFEPFFPFMLKPGKE